MQDYFCFKNIQMKNHIQHKNLDWEKISRYVSGEMTKQEKAKFEISIANNPEYVETIAATQSDLDTVDQFKNIADHFNADEAWKNLQLRIEPENKNIFSTIKRFRWSLVQVAAVMFAVVAMTITGYILYQKVAFAEQTILASKHEQGKEIILADGSSVVLNAGAEITYPKTFLDDIRSVHLTGEAFFSIQRNTTKPFIIITPKAEIKVLGTSFNVNASVEKTEVLVETGKVQLSVLENTDRHIILLKGDVGTLEENQLAKTQVSNVNYLSWKTHKMIFESTPLNEVSKVIGNTYGVEIYLPEETRDSLYFTSTFEREPLDIILESIGKSFNLTYEKNGSTITFKTN